MSPASPAFSSAASTARWTSSSTRRLQERTTPTEKERLAALKGRKIAIANAKLAYQDYKRLFSGARWDKLAAKRRPSRSGCCGLRPAPRTKTIAMCSMSKKLIGPNTVNTVPPATLSDAFRDHGQPRDSLDENIEEAQTRVGRTR